MELKFESINDDILKDLFIPKNLHRRKGKYIMSTSYNHEYIYLGRFDDLFEAQKTMYEFRYNRLINEVAKYNLNIYDAKILNNRYLIFKTGDIFNLFGCKIKGILKKSGYEVLQVDKKQFLIHRIIGMAFLDNPNNYPCINHIDGNKLNNKVENLEWCTYAYNSQHAHKNGLIVNPVGEETHSHKLTEKQVKFIREHYKPRDEKYGGVGLSKMFNISRSVISNIVHKNTWRSVK